jgi:cytochrome c556
MKVLSLRCSMTIWFNGAWREKLMKQSVAVALIITFAIVFMDTSMAEADNHGVIKKRTELMRNEVLGNFKVILRHVKGGKGSMSDVGIAARGLEAAAGKLLPLFPKGTGRPNYSAEETRSLNKIWEDWATFEKANNAMASHAAAIVVHAASNNANGLKESFGMLGKEGCSGCHKSFRGPKAK